MTDVEELLRQTLTDPRHKVDPGIGLYETVQARARDRRHRRTTVTLAAAAVIALAAVGTTLGVRSSAQHRVSPSNVPAPSSAPVKGSLGSAIDLGANSGQVINAVATANALYVLTANPNQIVALDPTGQHVVATAAAPPGTPSGIVVDEDTRVWAWSQDTGDVREYDAATLSPIGTEFTNAVHVPSIFNAVPVDGSLWLTSEQALFQWPTLAKGLAPQPTQIAGLDGFVYGLAADPARHRVLVGVTPTGSAPPNGFAGARIVAIDTRTGKVVAQSAQTSLGKESIAVVGDQVWVGGYGDVDQPRLLHLDAKTLKVVGTSPIGAQVGPGSIVWPGTNVVWARGGGDEQLGCLDPKTGAVLETWSAVQGPVTSVGGTAFGVENGLQPLTLAGACTG